MMQKRTIYSLLLISFILVFALSLSAQEVSIPTSINATRCESTNIDITVDSPTDLGAVEIVLEITGSGGAFFDAIDVNWDAGFTGLNGRYINIESNGTSSATVRILAMKADGADACLTGGSPVVIGQLQVTTNNVCSGSISIEGGTYYCPSFNVSTQFIDCATNEFVQAAVNGGTVTIVNQNPTIADIADQEVPWGTTFTTLAQGDDLDLVNGCETLEYSLVTFPDGMTINPNTGSISWATDGGDICTHDVVVQVEDACGATATDAFVICVSNEAPEMTCPAESETMFSVGDLVELSLTAIDPDGGPAVLTYTLEDFTGPGTPSLSATGEFSWQTYLDVNYVGEFDVTVIVTDGAATCAPCSPASADTCTFTLRIVNFLIAIEKTHGTIQGQAVDVDITGAALTYPGDEDMITAMGGFDFLIQYDNTALMFQYAEPGDFYNISEWEYFNYRYGPNGNCDNGCPSGEVRVVAIAETNNGGHHPKYFNTDQAGSNHLVRLRFLVTNDRTFECMYAPIRFVWYDCGDNSISSVDGNHLFISKRIFGYEAETSNDPYEFQYDMADPSADFPTTLGANTTCDVALEDGKPDPLRFITFINGGVDIVCADSIDARGDLNLNDIPYEVADAVLYSRYFVYGLGVFVINIDGQIAASDVNADGLTLSVSDLVYMIRVVIGDANPYPKEVVPSNTNYVHSANGTITLKSDIEVGAAHIVLNGDVTPTLLADNMEMIYNYNGANTNVLVYSLEGNTFSGDVINAVGEVVSIDMADRDGIPVVAKWIPDNFALNQNYPNPFNPTTTLSFLLPKATDYTLTVYNIQGQTVQTFEGSHEAGIVSIEWDASNMASGVYFYRLSADSFSDTKKMVLLK